MVTAVDGSASPGTCGVAGAGGSFTVAAAEDDSGDGTGGSTPVDVTASTEFEDSGDPSPSFADVCVGRTVEVSGAEQAGALQADKVSVDAEQGAADVEGTVLAVNGTTATGTCGTAGAAGSFTVSGDASGSDSSGTGSSDDGGSGGTTVDVSAQTTFADTADPSPSFADVCVGRAVKASGTMSGAAIAASSVTVEPPSGSSDGGDQSVSGTVTSVDGSTASGTCGTAGSPGTFAVGGSSGGSGPDGASSEDGGGALTVGVTAGTTFSDPAVPAASFADVCVGSTVDVAGTSSSGTFTASSVTVTGQSAAGSGDGGGDGGASGGTRFASTSSVAMARP
jgi:hypothetical protein